MSGMRGFVVLILVEMWRQAVENFLKYILKKPSLIIYL